jgi:hypothetical protein
MVAETRVSALQRQNGMQAAVLSEGVEVPVTIEEWDVMLNAVRCNEAVDGLTYRDASLAENTKVISGLLGHLDAAEHMQVEIEQQAPCRAVVRVSPEALEDLCQNEITHGDNGRGEKLIELARASVLQAVEVVDPDAAIHQNH